MLRRRTPNNRLLMGNLVSRDGKATALMLRYERGSKPELRRSVYHHVMDVIRSASTPHQEVFVAGMTAIETCISASGSFSATDQAARYMMKRAPSTSVTMSAALCWIAWKEPIGRPNWTRSLA